MYRNVRQLFVVIALIAVLQSVHAGDATWKLNPTGNDWNTAENWTPETIPDSETAVATFEVSHTTTVLCKTAVDGLSFFVGEVVFAPGASPYTIRITPDPDVAWPAYLSFNGPGITNNSGITQNLVAANSGGPQQSGRIYFQGTASAGENVVITNEGGASATGDGIYGGFTQFWDTSNAGKSVFVNNGGLVSGAVGGGTDLLFSSNAESAMFVNNPGAVSGAGAAYSLVQTFGNIGDSTFIANAATVSGAEGGWAEIDGGTSEGAIFIANGATIPNAQGGQIYVYGGDGYATFRARGGRGSGAEGGLIDLFNLPNSDQTVVIAEAGKNGGLGGSIMVEEDAVLDQGQFELHGNGTLDLMNATTQAVNIGSLAGNGVVLLAGHSLSIGNNNLSTIFSGIIQGSGSVSKVGTGTLTLSGASTYTSGTSVTAGTLRVTNQSGSATGAGAVKITAGTLGGSGIIAGKMMIGDGSGTSAFLKPSAGANSVAQLTLQKALTFKADGTYIYKLNTNNARADQVIANGVTIESGAQFDFEAVANKRLANGAVFTAISNTSGNPIAGAFANLPDGSTFTAGRNNYQANYEGGDGNDLTLTVVP